MTSDELKLAAEYHRGYEDGKKAKSADEWRLANERHKAVCNLRKLNLGVGDLLVNNQIRISDAIGAEFNEGDNFSKVMQDRLIYLLSGDDVTCPNANGTCPDDVPIPSSENECNFSTAEYYTDAEDAEPNPAETREEPSDHVSFGTHSITAELREWMRIVLTDDDPAYAIADRIDQAHADAMQSVYDELATELAKTKELLETSYAKRRAYKLHIDQMKCGSKKWRKRYEDAQTLAEVSEQECAEMLDLLRDAAREYQMREGALDAALAKLKDSIEPPKDRDGKTWHLGDSILYEGKAVSVDVLCLCEDGWKLGSDIYSFAFDANCCIHYPEHTAESIVRDLTLGRISESEAVKLIEDLRNE